MAVDYTTTGLLASVRRRGLIPSSSDNLDDDDLLALMTEELQTSVVGLLMSCDEEHYVTYEDISIVSGTDTYNIPTRAVGGVVRDVQKLDGSDYISLSRLEPETAVDSDEGFFFRDGALVLVPEPTSSGTLRVLYHRRPSKLVPTDEVAVISSIAAESGGYQVVTLTAAKPSGFTTSLTYDFIKASPSFRSLSDDEPSTLFGSTTTMRFTAPLPSDLAAGDYVCISGESPVAQMPWDLAKLLVLRTRFAALDSIGDPRAAQVLGMADAEFQRALKLLTPRNKGRGRKIINRFGPGWYRGPTFRR